MLIRCHICKKPSEHHARGLCTGCYRVANESGKHTQYQLNRSQKVESSEHSSEWNQNELATAARCLKCGQGIVKAIGLCETCYRNSLRAGELDGVDRNYFKTKEETELFVYLKRLERRMAWKET